MTSQQFLKAAEQLKLISDHVNSAIGGRDKQKKVSIANEHIKSLAETILQAYANDSSLIFYKDNGREYVDIWSSRENMMYCLNNYGMYINIDWETFRQKFPNALDFSRYRSNRNPNYLTFSND